MDVGINVRARISSIFGDYAATDELHFQTRALRDLDLTTLDVKV